MNIKQRLQDYKSTFHFCKKIRVFLFALCLLVAADRLWLVELDNNAPDSAVLASVAPASGAEELFSNITFSELAYEEPVKESFVDTLKSKLPLFGKEEKVTPKQHEAIVPAPIKGAKQIAIVIDDLGIDKKHSREIVEMANFKMTLAFLPYASHVQPLIDDGVANGHEIIVHMPMQPKSNTIDPGPVVLKVGMTAEQLQDNLDKGLSAFGGYEGINNHMGSRFTSDAIGMDFLMRELKKRDLFFLDSVTSPTTKGAEMAARHGVTYIRRNVFLDHEESDAFVNKALDKCRRIVAKDGLCIAIGHPKDVTIRGLNNFVSKAQKDGFEFVTVSDIIKQHKAEAKMHLVEAKTE
ncbi:MAG: hypothetical protein CL561_11760 [Alphaproteobacteria bacterium]|nr:hypothetical protein [Alphaproteobacteria bacterium]